MTSYGWNVWYWNHCLLIYVHQYAALLSGHSMHFYHREHKMPPGKIWSNGLLFWQSYQLWKFLSGHCINLPLPSPQFRLHWILWIRIFSCLAKKSISSEKLNVRSPLLRVRVPSETCWHEPASDATTSYTRPSYYQRLKTRVKLTLEMTLRRRTKGFRTAWTIFRLIEVKNWKMLAYFLVF